MAEQLPKSPFTEEMIRCLHPDTFDLGLVHKLWYERIIPKELIPEKFRREVTLPGGRKQILDTRVPGWTYHFDKGDGGAMVVCPEVAADDEMP